MIVAKHRHRSDKDFVGFEAFLWNTLTDTPFPRPQALSESTNDADGHPWFGWNFDQYLEHLVAIGVEEIFPSVSRI